MNVETIETPSLGDRSYLVHDGEVALVVDPQRDLDRVLSAADDAMVAITHVAETHLHNDYVSGGLALSRRTGATYLHAAAEVLPFDHRGVGDGDVIEVGSLTVRVVATPGHTQHHLSYHVTENGDGKGAGAGALFTGGSLLYGSVGRTDLVAADLTDTLTRLQYRSVRGMIDSLPGDTRFYPTHGFGSFCSSSQGGDDSDGTLAGERSVNLALTIEDEDTFVERLVSGLSDHPAYYAQMSPMNRAGGIPVDLSPAAPVDPTELLRRIHRGEWVVDLRNRRAYATDHLVGTIGIELDDPFATYLGWLIPWGTAVTLVADTAEELAEAQRQLARIGIDRPAGGADGGPDVWGEGHDRASYPVITFDQLAEHQAERGGVVLDVRRDDEWADGHLVGAVHIAIHQLLKHLEEVPDDHLLVHCASGFRASIAASLLARAGKDVTLIDDEYDRVAELDLATEP
ncbi:MAG: MBL fold metallo-hydrolase [Candidatus Microthrix parvicella]